MIQSFEEITILTMQDDRTFERVFGDIISVSNPTVEEVSVSFDFFELELLSFVNQFVSSVKHLLGYPYI